MARLLAALGFLLLAAVLASGIADDAKAIVVRKQGVPGISSNYQGGYVALGDSYSSGIGIGGRYLPDTVGRCWRSARAWPYLVQASLANRTKGGDLVQLKHLACSGAVIQDVIDDQLHALQPDTALVTISIGGNDLGFSDIMRRCVIEISIDWGCENDLEEVLPKLSAWRARLVALYKLIQARAPRATLVIAGYPNPVARPFGHPFGINIRAGEFAALKSLTDKVSDTIAEAVKAVGAVYVDMRTPFVGHGCGAERGKEEWINCLEVGQPILAESFHPNAGGHQVYAQEVLSVI